MSNGITFSEIRQILAEVAVSHKQIAKDIQEHRASQAETDREIRELRASQSETEKQLKETNRRLESFGIVQGEIAEDLYRRNAKVLPESQNFKVDRIITKLKREEGNEYDIVAINGKAVVVFEIKNKLSSDDVIRFVKVQLPKFRKNFPEYDELTLYGGIGALVVRNDLERQATKSGLFVLTQGSDGNAQIISPGRLREYYRGQKTDTGEQKETGKQDSLLIKIEKISSELKIPRLSRGEPLAVYV